VTILWSFNEKHLRQVSVVGDAERRARTTAQLHLISLQSVAASICLIKSTPPRQPISQLDSSEVQPSPFDELRAGSSGLNRNGKVRIKSRLLGIKILLEIGVSSLHRCWRIANGAGQFRTRLLELLRLGSTFGTPVIGGFSAFCSGS
jgi:hypothetical protein